MVSFFGSGYRATVGLTGMAIIVSLGAMISTVVAAGPMTGDDNVQISSIFDPISTPAQSVYELALLVLGICAGIFVIVAGFLTYTIIRFRRRKDDDGREPPQVYGSNPMELAWTIVPLLIVFVLFLVTARTIIATESAAPPPGRTDGNRRRSSVVVGDPLPGFWHRYRQ